MNTESKNENMTLYILKTIGFTLIGIVVAVFYVLSVMVGLVPKTAAGVFDAIGAEKAVTLCFENAYIKNPSNKNLYDLVQQAIVTDDYGRVIDYCYTIPKLKKYSEFENEINEMSRDGVEKDKIAYVYDIDSYLNSAYIKALYESGDKVSARQEFFTTDILRDDHPYTISMVTYINCLYADESMTKEEKNSDLSSFFTNLKVYGASIKEHLETRLNQIEDISEDTVNGKIFNVYSQIKVNTCFYKIYDILGNPEQKEIYEARIQELTQEYNNLIA